MQPGLGSPGKLESLAVLLVRHGEAVEADLLAHGVDLLDFWRGSLSARRLWVLIESWCMEPGSATSVSIHGDAGRWSVSDHILAMAHGVKPPEDKAKVEWKKAQQERIKRKRARVAAERVRQTPSGTAGST